MIINLYKVKKWGAFMLMAFLPTVTFFIMILMTDLIQTIIAFFMVTAISMVIASKITGHPIMELLEGKGLLVLTLDSTGVIDPFIVGVKNPYMRGKFKEKEIETLFDRESVNYLAIPKKVNATVEQTADPNIEKLTMEIPKDEKNSIMFGFRHFPVLIYNKNLETFITKDVLADFEKDTFVNHMVLYLNRKVEDLTSQLRDFARYIVEQTRPKKSIFSSGWFKWLLIIFVIVILVALLLPYIIGSMGTVSSGASKGLETIVKPFS